MSELKARHVADVYDDYSERPCEERSQVYLKSEADKVIEELEESHEKEVEQLILTIEQCKRAARTLRKKKEHSNYKRCLAMARLCHERSLWWYSKGYGFEKYDKFWEKWEKRWLELTEKFKEAK